MSTYGQQQYGGTIASDLGKLAIPLGLILSRAGLEKLIARGNAKKSKNGGSDEADKTRRRASIGGALRTKTPASPKAKSPPRVHVRVRVRGKSASPGKDKNADIRKHFQTIAIRVHEIFAKARLGRASPSKAKSPKASKASKALKASKASKALKAKAAKAKKAKRAK